MRSPFWNRGNQGGQKRGLQGIFQRIFDLFSSQIQVRVDQSFPTFFRLTSPLPKNSARPYTLYDPVIAQSLPVNAIPLLAKLSVDSGTSNLAAVHSDPDPDTIVRDAGSWITDGVEAGDMIRITSGLTGNNIGQFTIDDVAALILTLAPWEVLDTEAQIASDYEIVRGVFPAEAPVSAVPPTMEGSAYCPKLTFMPVLDDTTGTVDFEVWARNNDHSYSFVTTVFGLPHRKEVQVDHGHRPVLIRVVNSTVAGSLLIGPT